MSEGPETRRVGVVTTSRADFGHLRPVLHALRSEPSLRLEIYATGTHADANSISLDEMTRGGFTPDVLVPLKLHGDRSSDTAAALGHAVTDFAAIFRDHRPELLLVTGDRFEMYAVTVAAFVSGLLLAHLSGGDVTEGALDDGFRHSMTKLSHLHFPTNEPSARRVRQLGEEAWRVHVVGEPSLDRLYTETFPDDEELGQTLGLPADALRAPLLVTLHPATVHPETIGRQIANLVEVLEAHDGPVIITAANRDPGGAEINAALQALTKRRPRTWFFESVGWRNFVALMKRARAMVGNSSSGIVEAASFALPVVNIGDRQSGRLRAENVLDVADEPSAIRAGLARATSDEMHRAVVGVINPYGRGDTGARIARVLADVPIDDRLRIKRFAEVTR